MFHWCADETIALTTFLSSIPIIGTYAKNWVNKLRGKEHAHCHANHLHDHAADPNHPWTALHTDNDPIKFDDGEFSTFLSSASLEDLKEILHAAKARDDQEDIPMIEAEISARNS